MCRVLKQALRSSGANATERHIEEVSLCSLFLMEAAKKADREFGLNPRSTRHTTRDASADIRKVATHLLENDVTAPQTSRTNPPFRDVTEDGFSNMSAMWLKKVLTPTPDIDTTTSEQQTLRGNTTDFDHELHHVS